MIHPETRYLALYRCAPNGAMPHLHLAAYPATMLTDAPHPSLVAAEIAAHAPLVFRGDGDDDDSGILRGRLYARPSFIGTPDIDGDPTIHSIVSLARDQSGVSLLVTLRPATIAPASPELVEPLIGADGERANAERVRASMKWVSVSVARGYNVVTAASEAMAIILSEWLGAPESMDLAGLGDIAARDPRGFVVGLAARAMLRLRYAEQGTRTTASALHLVRFVLRETGWIGTGRPALIGDCLGADTEPLAA